MQLTLPQHRAITQASQNWFVDQLALLVVEAIPSAQLEAFRDCAMKALKEDELLLDEPPHLVGIWICCLYLQHQSEKALQWQDHGPAHLFELAEGCGLTSLMKILHNEFGRLHSLALPICNPVAHTFGYDAWALRREFAKLPVHEQTIYWRFLKRGHWESVALPVSFPVGDGRWALGSFPTLGSISHLHPNTGFQLLVAQRSLHVKGLEALQSVVHALLKQIHVDKLNEDPLEPRCDEIRLFLSDHRSSAVDESLGSIHLYDFYNRFLQVRWGRSTEGHTQAHSISEIANASIAAERFSSTSQKIDFKPAENERIDQLRWENLSDRVAGSFEASWGWLSQDNEGVGSAQWRMQALIDLKLQSCSFELSFNLIQGDQLTFYECKPVFPNVWQEEATLSLADLTAVESEPLEVARLSGPFIAEFANQNDPAGGLVMPTHQELGQWAFVWRIKRSVKSRRLLFQLSLEFTDLVLHTQSICPWSGVAQHSHKLASPQKVWEWSVNE